MYSILTTCNDAYAPFLDILISSIYKNTNINLIDKIFIVDLGLSKKYKTYLAKKTKIKFITKQSVSFASVNSKEWCNVIEIKTLILNKILPQIPANQSLIMLDNDTCVIDELSPLINPSYDIQLTNMLLPHKRRDGIFIKSIASMCIFNSIKSIDFVDRWIAIIKHLQHKIAAPFETPALNFTVNEFINKLNIQFLDEVIVCADRIILPETKIIHFKSNGSNQNNAVDNFESRISDLRTFIDQPINFLYYLNYDLFLNWRVQNENITTTV